MSESIFFPLIIGAKHRIHLVYIMDLVLHIHVA